MENMFATFLATALKEKRFKEALRLLYTQEQVIDLIPPNIAQKFSKAEILFLKTTVLSAISEEEGELGQHPDAATYLSESLILFFQILTTQSDNTISPAMQRLVTNINKLFNKLALQPSQEAVQHIMGLFFTPTNSSVRAHSTAYNYLCRFLKLYSVCQELFHPTSKKVLRELILTEEPASMLSEHLFGQLILCEGTLDIPEMTQWLLSQPRLAEDMHKDTLAKILTLFISASYQSKNFDQARELIAHIADPNQVGVLLIGCDLLEIIQKESVEIAVEQCNNALKELNLCDKGGYYYATGILSTALFPVYSNNIPEQILLNITCGQKTLFDHLQEFYLSFQNNDDIVTIVVL